ncbi:hypothetical protein MESS2_560014 [Mesorhizobium metallidurans STM 2683]|uniref:Uncharacterized protein n=1 Tax=Mesorhizobium metallidurans STM 2683 TaxID=1297569 RepID=M5F699_9HYPH|nr:hypothetical protein MESS2_560014 [Mesorhizobium metallidurans STM 2683]
MLAFSFTAETVSSARCSTVRLSSAASSSAMPFLKLLMPLAMSPISSGILPRPNTSSTITSTIIQCQIENEPIANLSRMFSLTMIYAFSRWDSNTTAKEFMDEWLKSRGFRRDSPLPIRAAPVRTLTALLQSVANFERRARPAVNLP